MSDSYIPIKTHFDIQSGFAFPSTSFIESGIPIVRMSDLKVGKLKFENTKYVSESWLKTASAFILKRGDFLLGMSGSLSNYAVVTEDDEPALLNQRVGRLKQRSKNADYEYLCYWLKSSSYAHYADIQGEGAAQKNISTKQIGQFLYRDTSTAKQKKISLILNSIECAIEKTEALIHKYQQIKAGLMHDLFTRGLTADGKLRPPREQAPELYQETPIGWIPKEWEVTSIEYYLDQIAGLKPGPFGSSLKKDSFVESGYKIYGQEQVIAGDLDRGDYYINQNKFISLQPFGIQENDILVSLVGTIGRVLVVRRPFKPGIINPRLMRIRLSSKFCNVEFLKHLLLSSIVRRQLEQFAGGGTMPVLNAGVVRKLKVPKIKDVNEQMQLAEIIDSCVLKIIKEELKLHKLKKQKSGLMHDLLTGKVPVKVDQEESAHG